jgi:hypothetical protein
MEANMIRSVAVVTLSALLLSASAATAHHKAGHQIPPGLLKKGIPAQNMLRDVEEVCLVTTAEWGDPYAELVATEWLPRATAERLAEEEGGFIILHPSLRTEEDCRDLLWEQ